VVLPPACAGADSSTPPQSDLVRIASITKVFTDLLLFKLRDAGTVILDAPLSKYVGKT